MLKFKGQLVLTTLFLYVFCKVNCEVFTALTDMEDLLNIEGNFLRYLNHYILKQERKLGYLKK